MFIEFVLVVFLILVNFVYVSYCLKLVIGVEEIVCVVFKWCVIVILENCLIVDFCVIEFCVIVVDWLRVECFVGCLVWWYVEVIGCLIVGCCVIVVGCL